MRPAASGVDAVDLLMMMLGIPSPSGEEHALVEHMCALLRGSGFATEVDAAGNLIARWGTGRRVVALVGHVDTVAGAIAVRRDGDVLHGRGAVDAKGPLAAAIAAVSRLPQDTEWSYVVVGAVDEERASSGARHLLATMRAPDALIILEPSGWDAVTVGYKGSVRLRWSMTQPMLHSAGPAPSAADRFVTFMAAIRALAASTRMAQRAFERIDVRVLRVATPGDGLEDTCDASIGVRIPPGLDVVAFIDAARALPDGDALIVLGSEPAVRTDSRSVLARAFIGAIRECGGAPRFKVKTGTSDLNILAPAWGCPAIAYGPGDSRLDHAPNEHIAAADVLRATEVIDAALGALA